MPCEYLVLSPFSGIRQQTQALLGKGGGITINIRSVIHCHTDNQLVYPAHQFICYSSVYAIKSNIKKKCYKYAISNTGRLCCEQLLLFEAIQCINGINKYLFSTYCQLDTDIYCELDQEHIDIFLCTTTMRADSYFNISQFCKKKTR